MPWFNKDRKGWTHNNYMNGCMKQKDVDRKPPSLRGLEERQQND